MRSRAPFPALDFLAVVCAFLLGYAFRFSTGVFPDRGVPPFGPYLRLTVLAAAGWVVILHALGVYRRRIFVNFTAELAGLLQGAFWAMVFTMAGTFFYRGFSYSRLAVGFSGVFTFLLQWAVRFACAAAADPGGIRVLVVGSDEAVETLLRRFSVHRSLRFNLRAIPSADPDRISAELAADAPDCIIARPAGTGEAIALQSAAQERRIPVYILPGFEQFLLSGGVEDIDGLPLVVSGRVPVEVFPGAAVKRLADLVVGTILCGAFCAVLPAIAAAIAVDSPGPVFFRQARVGRRGRPFRVFKLRTMRVAEPGAGLPYTTADDPRVTAVGRFLRRWNLDELPQIFNVLSGEMYLVGPRPISLDDTFFLALPGFALRARALPGITGWAQIHGLRGGHNAPLERLQYDLYYIENWSFWLDGAIVLSSAFAFRNAR